MVELICPYCYSGFLEEVSPELDSSEEESFPRLSFIPEPLTMLVEFNDYNVDERVEEGVEDLAAIFCNDQIKAIPTVVINSEFLEKDIQCAVCLEKFNLQEKAKQLPCSHLYHEKCIIPWLERQATCPNCRSQVQYRNRSITGLNSRNSNTVDSLEELTL
ncbi:e3 ubiquitin-protein ligase RNF126, partial [Trichonephila clavipes]